MGTSGIGLVLSRQIVEDHGGTLEFDGLPGQGTVVTVLLPATQGAAVEVASPGEVRT